VIQTQRIRLPRDDKNKSSTNVLSGTTLRVYRYLYRKGTTLGIHDIQRGVGLSSPSVADYHVKKLLSAGLIKEEGATSRYYVERIVFENMIRIRKSLIPLQVSYAAFFATALVVLVSLLRPPTLSGAYLFSLLIIAISLCIFVLQSIRDVRTQGI
jgi:DNA-binding Lrp family transcriptional regulator